MGVVSLVVVLVVLVILLASGVIPSVPYPTGATQNFSGTTSGVGCTWSPYTVNVSTSTFVRFIWAVQGNVSQTLTVTGPSGLVFTGSGVVGSGGFSARAGAYSFSGISCATATIEIAGYY